MHLIKDTLRNKDAITIMRCVLHIFICLSNVFSKDFVVSTELKQLYSRTELLSKLIVTTKSHQKKRKHFRSATRAVFRLNWISLE